ncbi:MAG: VTT domain-containing protein, partial [Candidatus Binataceae bacterium]
MKRRGLIYRLIVAAALVAAIAWIALHRELLEAAALQRELSRFGRWAPILFVGLYALSTVLFVPGSLLTVAGGALFGPVWGTMWNLGGATLGATIAFISARYMASAWVANRAGARLDRLMRGAEEEGWRFVAFVRLVPLFPFNLVNYAFGLTRIRLGEYVLASVVCMAPGAIAYTYLGYAGREATAGSAGAIRNGLIALALLAAIGFLPRLVRRLRGPRDLIEAAELRRRLEHVSETVVIDVRTADEFDGPLGHIHGARTLVLADLPAQLE